MARFSDDEWDRLTDALVEVFGAEKISVDAETAVFKRDEETFLRVYRYQRVEGGMPLHRTVLTGVDGITVENEAVTFHAGDDAYTYRRPF